MRTVVAVALLVFPVSAQAEAPFAKLLAKYLQPGAKLPTPTERTKDRLLYSLSVEGLTTADLRVWRASKATWDLVVIPAGVFAPDSFGVVRKLCDDGMAVGPKGERATTIYLVESGPLSGTVIDFMRDPSNPGGSQAALYSIARARQSSTFLPKGCPVP